jgi:annexin A7/11
MIRSRPQLLATFKEYRKVSQYDITRSIEHEMSGDLKRGMKAGRHPTYPIYPLPPLI